MSIRIILMTRAKGHYSVVLLALEGSLSVDTFHATEWVTGVEAFNVTLIDVFTHSTVRGVSLWTGAGSVGALSSNNFTDNIVTWVVCIARYMYCVT